jgi:hypothetical protein
MDRRLFLLSALALIGCAASPPAVRAADRALPELESIYRAEARREGMVISVASNGCTQRADFTFHVEKAGETTTVAFARKRLDTCNSFAMGRMDLSFTWEELGVAPRTPVVLLNPLIQWPYPQ